MTTLLIPTNSVDGTCDALIDLARQSNYPVLRWNVDLWQHYETVFNGEFIQISDPAGRVVDTRAKDLLLLWRKPYVDLMNFDGLGLKSTDRVQAKSQIGQWLRTLSVIMKSDGRTRLVEPYADNRLPKLYQLSVAREYFRVPRTHYSIGEPTEDFSTEVITKALGDPSIRNGRIFYTRRVNPRELYRPYPWFLQQALIGGHDVTCVYILGKCYFFISEYLRTADAIDWRVEINSKHCSAWKPLQHPTLGQWEHAVRKYMQRLQLHYGRLDFIMQGREIFFLECNSNGQFGWLDDPISMRLHKEFLAAAINPTAAVF
jgi:hypothetical protein